MTIEFKMAALLFIAFMVFITWSTFKNHKDGKQRAKKELEESLAHDELITSSIKATVRKHRKARLEKANALRLSGVTPESIMTSLLDITSQYHHSNMTLKEITDSTEKLWKDWSTFADIALINSNGEYSEFQELLNLHMLTGYGDKWDRIQKIIRFITGTDHENYFLEDDGVEREVIRTEGFENEFNEVSSILNGVLKHICYKIDHTQLADRNLSFVSEGFNVQFIQFDELDICRFITTKPYAYGILLNIENVGEDSESSKVLNFLWKMQSNAMARSIVDEASRCGEALGAIRLSSIDNLDMRPNDKPTSCTLVYSFVLT